MQASSECEDVLLEQETRSGTPEEEEQEEAAAPGGRVAGGADSKRVRVDAASGRTSVVRGTSSTGSGAVEG